MPLLGTAVTNHIMRAGCAIDRFFFLRVAFSGGIVLRRGKRHMCTEVRVKAKYTHTLLANC